MKRLKLNHAVIAACISTTALVSTSAFANNEDLYFYPKNKWVIERIAQADKNALPSCALSNQLNNGYIVQIAGTQNGMTNINLDVRQKAFQESKPYEVVYSIPGQDKKILPTRAFGESLLVSDLRSASDFAEKLPEASVLDVSVQGNEFRIYLTGLSASLSAYNDCVTPEKPEALVKAQPTIIPEANVPESSSLTPPPPAYQAKAGQTVKAAAQTNAALRPEMTERKRYTEQLSERLKQESEQYKAPSADTNPQMINDQASAADAAMKDTQGSSKITKKSSTPEIAYTVQKLEKPMEADLTKSASAQDMMEEMASIAPASGGHNDALVHMRDKISQLEKTVATLRAKNEMLDTELKTALEDAKDERMSVSSDNWNLERATMRFNESERQIERLGRQLQSQRAQCEMEKSELKTMLFDPKLTQQQQLAQLSSLEQDLENAKADMYMQQRQYEERIRILQQQLEGN